MVDKHTTNPGQNQGQAKDHRSGTQPGQPGGQTTAQKNPAGAPKGADGKQQLSSRGEMPSHGDANKSAQPAKPAVKGGVEGNHAKADKPGGMSSQGGQQDGKAGRH